MATPKAKPENNVPAEQPNEADLSVDGEAREAEFDRLEAEAVQTLSGEVVDEKKQSTAETIEPLFEQFFSILTPGWGVKKNECQLLAQAYGALIDKHFKEGFGKYDVEITVIIATGSVIGPKLRLPRQLDEEIRPGAGAGGVDPNHGGT
jgi:hypothetical protein